MIGLLLALVNVGCAVWAWVMVLRLMRRTRRLERALRDVLARIDLGKDRDEPVRIFGEQIEAWEEALR